MFLSKRRKKFIMMLVLSMSILTGNENQEKSFAFSIESGAVKDDQTSVMNETECHDVFSSSGLRFGAARDFTKKKWKKVCKTGKGKTYMTFSYQYPFVKGNSAVANKINQFYKKARKDWYAADRTYRAEAKELWKSDEHPSGHYSDDVSCLIGYSGNDYIGILQDGYIYTGGAHGSPYRLNAIFSAKTGKQVSAMEITGKTKKELNQIVRKDLKKSFRKNPKDFYDKKTFLEGLKYDFAGKGSYYLMKDKKSGKPYLTFYAEPYLLAPYAAGYIETNPVFLR